MAKCFLEVITVETSALERARGCMTAAGMFFQPGAEDISQAIELGLRTEEEPEEVYKICVERVTADKSVLAMASLIIFFLVRDNLPMKKACMAAWKTADKFKDSIIKSLADALIAADTPKRRGQLVANFLESKDLRDKLGLSIYLNVMEMEDTFHAHLIQIEKLPEIETRIMASAFSGAIYGLKEVSAEIKEKH